MHCSTLKCVLVLISFCVLYFLNVYHVYGGDMVYKLFSSLFVCIENYIRITFLQFIYSLAFCL